MSRKKMLLAVPLAMAAALTFTACASADTEKETDDAAMSETTTEMVEAADPTEFLVGSGCAAYAEEVPSGPGSVAGMFDSNVVEAASNNPMLTMLASAVSGGLNPDVDLVETLNGGEFTVFAPVDEAFGKIDAATVETLKTDSDLLSSILTYHVVAGQALPDDLPGDHATVQGDMVTVTGSGDSLKVNDANVICGGVQTENATVYLIDSVLMPTS